MRPSAAIESLRRRIEQSVSSKFGLGAAGCIYFKVERRPTRDRVVALLDPKDWNITVRTAEELSSRANELLVAQYAKRFSLDKSDAQFIDFAIALRNYLGHRSDGSRADLKRAMKALSEACNVPFQASLNKIGSYLKARDARGKTRAVLFAERLIQISEKL